MAERPNTQHLRSVLRAALRAVQTGATSSRLVELLRDEGLAVVVSDVHPDAQGFTNAVNELYDDLQQLRDELANEHSEWLDNQEELARLEAANNWPLARKLLEKDRRELNKLNDVNGRLREAVLNTTAALGGCATPLSKDPCGSCVVCRARAALGDGE